PWWVTCSVVSSSSTCSSPSRKRAWDSSGEMPKRRNSCGRKARAKPTSRRPPDNASSMAISPAGLSGGWDTARTPTGARRGGRAGADGGRALRERRQEDDGVRRVAAIGLEIVLDRARVREPERIGFLRQRQRFGKIGVGALLRRPDAGEELHAELHQ